MGTSRGAPLHDPDHHAARRPGADRPGPHLLHQGPQARAAQRHPPVRPDTRADQAVHGRDGREGPPQARQRHQTVAGGRPVPQAPSVEVLLPQGGPGPPSYPPGGRQGAHPPPRDSSVTQATALARHLQVEQDRAPAVLPDQPGLARPPPDQLRRHHRHHRRRHDHDRAHRPCRPGRELLPCRPEDQRRADQRHRGPLLSTS